MRQMWAGYYEALAIGKGAVVIVEKPPPILEEMVLVDDQWIQSHQWFLLGGRPCIACGFRWGGETRSLQLTDIVCGLSPTRDC